MDAEGTATVAMTEPSAPPAQVGAGGDQRVTLETIGWAGFRRLLQLRGGATRPQFVYLDGDVILMSPSHIHERRTDRLGMFVRAVFEELDIPCIPTRETLFRRRGRDAGVQPDDSFYFTHLDVIAAKDGKRNIDLRVDPPPDLAIEVVHTHDAAPAVEVLRRLRVPEVWVCDDQGLCILVRRANGRYVASDRSLVFPFLTAAEVFDWIDRSGMASTTQWVKQLRRWIRETLVPRVQLHPDVPHRD